MTVFWQVVTSDAVATHQDMAAFTGRPWQRPWVTVPSHISPGNPGLLKRAWQVEVGEGPRVLTGRGKDMIPCPQWLYRGPGQSIQQILTSWVKMPSLLGQVLQCDVERRSFDKEHTEQSILSSPCKSINTGVTSVFQLPAVSITSTSGSRHCTSWDVTLFPSSFYLFANSTKHI